LGVYLTSIITNNFTTEKIKLKQQTQLKMSTTSSNTAPVVPELVAQQLLADENAKLSRKCMLYRRMADSLRKSIIQTKLEAVNEGRMDKETLKLDINCLDDRELFASAEHNHPFKESVKHDHLDFAKDGRVGTHTASGPAPENYPWVKDTDSTTVGKYFNNGVPEFISQIVDWFMDSSETFEIDDKTYFLAHWGMRKGHSWSEFHIYLKFQQVEYVTCEIDGERYDRTECYTDGDVYIHESNFDSFYRCED